MFIQSQQAYVCICVRVAIACLMCVHVRVSRCGYECVISDLHVHSGFWVHCAYSMRFLLSLPIWGFYTDSLGVMSLLATAIKLRILTHL